MVGLILVLVSFGLMNIERVDSYEKNALNENAEPAAADITGTRAGSQRTVLAELFTNWDCPPCALANPPLNELCDVFGPDQLVMIGVHSDFPGPDDPFYLFNAPDNDVRISYYGVPGYPDAYFDGVINEYGASGSPTDMYNTYKADIMARLLVSSPVNITLEGYLDIGTMTGHVNATVEVTDTLPMGSLVVRTIVTEDNRYAEGTNGEVRHRNVLRDLLADEPLPALIVGQTHSFSRSFPINMQYNPDNLQIVVFLQNDAGQEVQQAAMYDFNPQRVLVVDDDQSMNPLGQEDEYQKVLTFLGFPFDSYVLNEVGSPTSFDLSGYEAVLWLTSTTSSSTLTASDQLAISTYLDAGLGSLFMCGQNIGSDIGGTAFYADYLHSTFVTDDKNENEIEGISGDAISDPFAASKLAILNDSPSEIAPIPPATATFLYSVSKTPAAVKAEHDIDSRVVYMAFMYFEYSDPITTKANVMIQVLMWLTDMHHRMELAPGMNLISLPAVQFDTSVDTVLDSISGNYDSVATYNTSHGDWKHVHSSKPVSMNDLTDINHHTGLWIHVTSPGNIVFVYSGGDIWQTQFVHLYQGWNLVGYPSAHEYDRTTGLNNLVYGTDVECVQTFDSETQQWVELGPSDSFELGCGYWIYSNAEQDWEVPV